MKFYYDEDADLSLLRDRTIAVIGYGNQGRAHALNLKDSGLDVVVGLRKNSPNIEEAITEGLKTMEIAEASEAASLIVILIPDEFQASVYEKDIRPFLKDGDVISFAHGFNLLFNKIIPPENVDAVINSPKCIGYLVRENFIKGHGFPNLFGVYRDASGKARDIAIAYAKGIGGTRTGVMESTVKEEAVTNLFAEQSILCGGIAELIKAGFDTLVEAGYSPEVAYFECLHEIKPIIDLFYREGLAEMNRRISNTAEFGEYVSGKRVINEGVREAMKDVLADIEDGKFADRWMNENEGGCREFMEMRAKSAAHPIEKVGDKLRKMMPWLKK